MFGIIKFTDFTNFNFNLINQMNEELMRSSFYSDS